MKRKTVLLGVLFAAHGAITARALMDHGYLELFRFAFSDWPARQLFSDLCVGMLLITSWMLSDARRTGRRAWPFVVATFFLGSFAPLAYLLLGARRRPAVTAKAAAPE